MLKHFKKPEPSTNEELVMVVSGSTREELQRNKVAFLKTIPVDDRAKYIRSASDLAAVLLSID